MDFDKKYKVYRWYHWMNLHWMINPGLAVNELLLGQRIPNTILEDQTSEEPRSERIYIPCPHCGKKHRNLTWSKKNGTGFKNWFGLYCPNCGNMIPCLINITTALILAITFPVWGWFKNIIKTKWLKRQPSRFKNLDLHYSEKISTNYLWIKQGLKWGVFMFIFMTFLIPLMIGQSIVWERILIGIPIWTMAGLAWGYVMRWYMSKKGRKRVFN